MHTPNDHLPPPWRGRNDFLCNDLPTSPCTECGLVLVTGASGYIGGRLVPELVRRGYRVRVMVRGDVVNYQKIWPDTEVVEGDALDVESLKRAMVDVFAAYYLIHSLVLGPTEFAETDLKAARNFCQAADESNLKRIIYLGGLGSSGDCGSANKSLEPPLQNHGDLSNHLNSRNQVSCELAKSRVPLTTLRASVIVGSGSASFEIIKNLARHLRIVPLPRWAKNSCQPIGIRDVVKYLVGVMESPLAAGQVFDVGGPEKLTYAEMMKIVWEILQKPHRTINIPINGTRFFGYVASLLTPVPAPITQCLFDSLVHDTVCQCNTIRLVVPFEPLSYREALIRALNREEQDLVASRWSDSYPPAHELKVKLHQLRQPPRFRAHYELETETPAEDLFAAITAIGGNNGWFKGNWMWRVRGLIDRLFFGVGMTRGRRSSKELRVYDVIDVWRVEDLQTDQRLLLRAEMRMPGHAWLEFKIDKIVNPSDNNASCNNLAEKNLLGITAHYATKRLGGHIYWRFFQPFHWYIFDRLLTQLDARAQLLGKSVD
ncbi:MAG: SDR family oxidoreductase [bacterium]|nr:SDR family oxidoreductase [bacterium]